MLVRHLQVVFQEIVNGTITRTCNFNPQYPTKSFRL
jgi:hypothetical protein